MIQSLRKIFPSLRIHKAYNPNSEDYCWFITEDGELLSILKRDLGNKDKEILSVFLQPIQEEFPLQTENELVWFNRIFQNQAQEDKEANPYRFVYFDIEGESVDPILFKSAIEEVFSREIPILWKNKHEGVIIEDKRHELIDYTQIIDVLMSDLYVNIKFYVGQLHEDLSNIHQRYESILATGKLGIKLVKKPVFSYIDILPHMILQFVDNKVKQELVENVLKDFKNDKETLKMIETFINCNLNISLTAKQLYLHRNSLQYRIDKFIEQTNIDIREFHHALAVYFALLSLGEGS